MYKLHHDNNNTDIFFPDRILDSSITVIETGHSFPPAGYASMKNKRNAFVLHYVLQGKGTYFDMPLEAPCGFLMTPDKLQYYTVDPDPSSPSWEQYWIMFSGEKAEAFLTEAGFCLSPHIFGASYINQVWQIFEELHSPANYISQNDCLYMLSGLFRLLSLNAISIQNTNNDSGNRRYVGETLAFIHQNYASHICEDDIAASIHLSTKYMHRIFKLETGTSPIQYLNMYRIKCAKRFLDNHIIPIKQVAESVGFDDPNYFCRVFQRFNNGISPLQYRKSARNRKDDIV